MAGKAASTKRAGSSSRFRTADGSAEMRDGFPAADGAGIAAPSRPSGPARRSGACLYRRRAIEALLHLACSSCRQPRVDLAAIVYS